MKRYFLLRDNRESGPFTMEQLAQKGLKPRDLLWVEGEGRNWCYPSELAGFEMMVREEFPRMRKVSATRPQVRRTERIPAPPPLKERKLPQATTPVFRKKVEREISLFTPLTVFFGLVLGAMLLKRMVEGNDPGNHQPPTGMTEWITKTPVEVPGGLHAVAGTSTAQTQDIPDLEGLKITYDGASQLQVNNSTGNFLDRIVIGVDYLAADGSLVRSEEMVVRSIGKNEKRIIKLSPAAGIRYKVMGAATRKYGAMKNA